MRYRVLGPLAVVRDEEARPLSSGKVRTLLASFLLHADHAMPVPALVERLWGDDPPRAPRRVTQSG